MRFIWSGQVLHLRKNPSLEYHLTPHHLGILRTPFTLDWKGKISTWNFTHEYSGHDHYWHTDSSDKAREPHPSRLYVNPSRMTQARSSRKRKIRFSLWNCFSRWICGTFAWIQKSCSPEEFLFDIFKVLSLLPSFGVIHFQLFQATALPSFDS